MSFTNITVFASRIKHYSSIFTFLILYELSVNPLTTDIIKPHSFMYSLYIVHDCPEKVSKEKGEREILQKSSPRDLELEDKRSSGNIGIDI